ncbi:hypothetical protein OkiPb00494_36270 [Escherichia coli]|nr:RNA-directed DNA polymerase [Escherichia coli ATCC BAA-2219]BCS62634.1 hypothetical protein EC51104_3649 [Escherichia coli]BCS78154.1 hypothetical protein E15042_3625 [Escherichia coli]
MGNLYRSVSQITRDKFERTMPQAYCCWAYNFSGKEYHVYAKFIIRCAVSRLGVSMSKPHLWQEARGTGGDTAKLG